MNMDEIIAYFSGKGAKPGITGEGLQDMATPLPIAQPFDVAVSNTTAPMAGRIEGSEIPGSMPPIPPLPKVSTDFNFVPPTKPRWEIENDPSAAIEEPSAALPSKVASAAPSTPKDEPALPSSLSASNDNEQRIADEKERSRKRTMGAVGGAIAGIGDAIGSGLKAFKMDVPTDVQGKVLDRAKAGYEEGSKAFETKLRDDANSDVSKQYQALVGQFLQKDPKDPTILGLTANQIAEKIPQIEKLATLRQQEELKKIQLADSKEARLARQDAAQDKVDLKAQGLREKKQASIDSAKQQAGTIRGTIKDIINRDLVGFDTTGPGGSKMFAPFDYPDLKNKLDTIAGNIAFATLSKMRQDSPSGGAVGQVSDKDMALLASVKGSLTQEQTPRQLLETLNRLDELYTRVEGYDADITSPWKDTSAAPEASKSRTTKTGITYTKGK